MATRSSDARFQHLKNYFGKGKRFYMFGNWLILLQLYGAQIRERDIQPLLSREACVAENQGNNIGEGPDLGCPGN